ncbi:MAG TPA: SdpI family protein [Gemmatimonadaceae bacterium]|jgi:hypothetical protein|nr:SdpI family protein [Gemmatimonadaceae bacterium]
MRRWATAIPVAAAFAFSAAVFSRLPESADPNFSAVFPLPPSDGDMLPRTFLALMLPVTALVSWVLVNLLSRVSKGGKPLPDWWINENTGAAAVKRFEPTFNTILFAVMSLFLLIHLALLGSVLGWPAWSYQVIVAIFGLGLIGAGNVMPRTKPNWMMGLRTKRTLADPVVWSRTHRMFGAMMVVAGALVIVSAIVAVRYALVIAVGTLAVGSVIAYVFGTRSSSKFATESTGR